MDHASRAAVSLLVHVGAALAVLLALEPVLRARADLTPDAMASYRGIGLTVLLISAVAIWALPSLLPRRQR